ncbi:MAG TPA: hypothetical protein VFA26_08085 [Gemmataceae bacterium]|nr:hypothetical protein [Gemmataceae bacterium]
MNDLTIPDPWAQLYGELRLAANHWDIAAHRPEPEVMLANWSEPEIARYLPVVWASPRIRTPWTPAWAARSADPQLDEFAAALIRLGYGIAPITRREREAADARTRDALFDPFATALPWRADACDRLPLGVRGLGVIPDLGTGAKETAPAWRVPECPPWSCARGRARRRLH